MNPKYKILLYLGGLMLLGFLTYLVFRTYSTRPGNTTASPAPGTKIAQDVGLAEKVFFPSLSADGQELYYLGDHGSKLKKYNFSSGETKTLNDNEVLFTVQAFWSPDKSMVILKNNDPKATTTTRFYNLQNKSIKDLSPAIGQVLWNSDAKKIYYQFKDATKNELQSANSDGSNFSKIIDLKYDDYGLIWLDNFQKIGFWSIPGDVGGTVLNILDLQSKKTSQIFSDYSLSDAVDSPNGDFIAYVEFQKSDNTTTLACTKADGSSINNLKINTTLDKAAWVDDNQLIAAFKGSSKDDDFLLANCSSGETNKFEIQSQSPDPIDAQNLMVSQSIVYFTSNDTLYKMALNK